MQNRSSNRKSTDANLLAKYVVDKTTAEAASHNQPNPPSDAMIRSVMSEMGRKGGLKGGRARAEKLSAKKRSEIAASAAIARWSKHKGIY